MLVAPGRSPRQLPPCVLTLPRLHGRWLCCPQQGRLSSVRKGKPRRGSGRTPDHHPGLSSRRGPRDAHLAQAPSRPCPRSAGPALGEGSRSLPQIGFRGPRRPVLRVPPGAIFRGTGVCLLFWSAPVSRTDVTWNTGSGPEMSVWLTTDPLILGMERVPGALGPWSRCPMTLAEWAGGRRARPPLPSTRWAQPGAAPSPTRWQVPPCPGSGQLDPDGFTPAPHPHGVPESPSVTRRVVR